MNRSELAEKSVKGEHRRSCKLRNRERRDRAAGNRGALPRASTHRGTPEAGELEEETQGVMAGNAPSLLGNVYIQEVQ